MLDQTSVTMTSYLIIATVAIDTVTIVVFVVYFVGLLQSLPVM
jgi:hypothetical protein